MLDIKWIRENQQEFDRLLQKRAIKAMSAEIVKLDEHKRQLINSIQELQQARNEKSKTLAAVNDKQSEQFISIRNEVEHINQKIKDFNEQLKDNDLQDIMDRLPNILDSQVPFGTSENDNILIKEYGTPIQNSSFKQHFEIGEQLKMMDFTQTAKISGSRFVTLKGGLAKLERALINFMIDIHTNQFGFTELSTPCLVKPSSMYNTAQLPKLAEESFLTTTDYRLIPTGEVTLTNMVADSILLREELPIRYVAHTQCFRSEAGSAGRDTRGMIRVHQFSKVELVTIATPQESASEHEYMLGAAEEILKKLNLPYRVMLLCSGDTGFAAQKTYDIEVWLPGQKRYREISSCSNCGDFQARRMKTRYKEFYETNNKFVHTLNGSALPIGRTIVAIMENYQNEDGSVTVPPCLVDYMNGIERIDLARR
ncbi:MAG: serine--tRNA ligase [Rickettsiaceae bacterium]|nr:MAG: serine--tRNA ligase [Rickettsiaceae bacterium]